MDEETNVVSKRGKWGVSGVPHKGWRCVGIEDLGSPTEVCEMCESQEIRYVHAMVNERHEGELRVGCVCAGHMEGDIRTARAREASLKSRAGKRRRWLSRNWRISYKGNIYIKTDGFVVTIWKRDARWGYTLIDQATEEATHSRRKYDTQLEAQLAAFDAITYSL